MVYVAAHGSAEGTGQGFEDGFCLMVLIVAVGLDIEVHQGGVREALEEMEEHLGGHVAYMFAMELGLPDEPGASAEVEGDMGMTVVHGQGEAVALDAALGAQRLVDALAQGEGGILDGVVLVNVEVALGVNEQVHLSVAGYLFQHVVKKSEACLDISFAGTGEREAYVDIGLLGGAYYLSGALAVKDLFGYLLPRERVAQYQ